VISDFSGVYAVDYSLPPEDPNRLTSIGLDYWVPYFEYDSRFLILPSSSGTTFVRDVDTWKARQELKDHRSRVVSCHLDGDVFANGGWDKTCNLYTYSHETGLWENQETYMCPAEIQSISFNSTSLFLGEGSRGKNYIHVRDIETRKELGPLTGMQDWVIHIHPAEELLYACGSVKDEGITVWDLRTTKTVSQYVAGQGRIRRFILDDTKLVSASSRGFVHCWDIRKPFKALYEVELPEIGRVRCCQQIGNEFLVSRGTRLCHLRPDYGDVVNVFNL
jgi:WD40 repeat protein